MFTWSFSRLYSICYDQTNGNYLFRTFCLVYYLFTTYFTQKYYFFTTFKVVTLEKLQSFGHCLLITLYTDYQPGVGVCPGAEELQHDVVVAAARRQVQRGLGLVVLVIHRVAVLGVVCIT